MTAKPGWLATAGLLLALSAMPLAAQEGDDRAARYAALAQLPPLEGVWQAERGMVTALRAAEGSAPLTEQARATARKTTATQPTSTVA